MRIMRLVKPACLFRELLSVLLMLLLLLGLAAGQAIGTVSTLAGRIINGYADGVGTAATFEQPTRVTFGEWIDCFGSEY